MAKPGDRVRRTVDDGSADKDLYGVGVEGKFVSVRGAHSIILVKGKMVLWSNGFYETIGEVMAESVEIWIAIDSDGDYRVGESKVAACEAYCKAWSDNPFRVARLLVSVSVENKLEAAIAAQTSPPEENPPAQVFNPWGN